MKKSIILIIIALIVGFGIGLWVGNSNIVNNNEGEIGGAATETSIAPINSLSGTIKSKKADGLVVEIDLNYPPKEREVVVGDVTKITRNGESATLSDLQVGDYVFLNARENIAEKQKFEVESVFVKVPAQ